MFQNLNISCKMVENPWRLSAMCNIDQIAKNNIQSLYSAMPLIRPTTAPLTISYTKSSFLMIRL